MLFIYYSQYSFVLFHLFSTFSFLFSFVRTMFFFSCHHLSIYYTDSKNNALSMTIMSFFRSRSRIFLLDPYLHFLFALVYFQSCLFSLFLLLLVLCVVYILFSILFCFVSSIQYLFFPVLIHWNYVFFPAITYQHIILYIFFLPSPTCIFYFLFILSDVLIIFSCMAYLYFFFSLYNLYFLYFIYYF